MKPYEITSFKYIQFIVCQLYLTSVQLLSHVQLFTTPWTAACQASLFTNFWSLLKLMSIKLVMLAKPSHPLSSPSPPAFSPSQHQGLFKGAVLPTRWPKYWSCSFSISPSNEYSGLISFRIDWLNLLPVQGILKFNTTVQKHQFLKHQFFSTQLS